MSALRLAISPLTWCNDDMPALGGHIPLETCWSQMREAGFCGTELGARYPREPAVLLPQLREHGLQLASGWCSGNLLRQDADAEWQAIAPHVALLVAAGVHVMVYGEVSNTVHGDIGRPLSSRIRLSDHEFRRYGRQLTTLAGRLLSEAGIRLAFHHHVGTIVETSHDIAQLMDATGDAVGLTFDSGHAAFGGAEPAALLRTYASRIAHVHFKDVRPAVLRHTREHDGSFLRAVLDGAFTVPGDGAIDFAPMVATLREIGYRGWLVVEAEQDPAKADPLTHARMAHEHICGLLQAAGYSRSGSSWTSAREVRHAL